MKISFIPDKRKYHLGFFGRKWGTVQVKFIEVFLLPGSPNQALE